MPLRRSLSLIILWVAAGLSLAPGALGAPSDLATVSAHLKRAESNLQLVDSSIGHLKSPPKGSAAKLAQMRLGQAFGDLEPAGKILSALSGQGVPEAKTRYDAAVVRYERLGEILTGKPQPSPEPTPEPDPKPAEDPAAGGEAPPAKPATVRLGYPHADNLKNALFTVRRVEGDAGGLATLRQELSAVTDQLAVPHGRVFQAVATIAETRRQAGFAQDGLAKVPANGEGVAEAKERLAAARATVDSADAYFRPLHEQLAALIDPARYPEFHADLKRLTELARPYSNPAYSLREARTEAAEALAQGEAAKAECIRVARVYERLMQQQTDQGKRIEVAGNNFLSSYQGFLAAAAEAQANLPGEIRKDLAEADRMASDAVTNQKPLWFAGGIPQQMGFVDDKFALYAALDPAGAAALASEVDALKASLSERADSLRELIIRENPLPADLYAGADRESVVAKALEIWKAQEADAQVLAVRIPSEAWSRETKWSYSNGTWYFIDKSKLQVRLIVADANDAELAIDRPINIRMDHQQGDTLSGFPMRSADEVLEPSEYVLRSRLK